MLALLHGDISSAARVLLGVPPNSREPMCWQLIAEAEAADQHVKATGRLHPYWGNGSLMSAARKHTQADEPNFDHADYSACFELVLRCLRKHSRMKTTCEFPI